MKKKAVTKNAFIAILVSFICFFVSVSFMTPVKADGSIGVSANTYDLYTETDSVLSYPDKTIQDYSGSLYATKCRPCFNENNDFILTDIGNDDPIVGIVPKGLFSQQGNELHIGKEYGFFIDTKTIGNNFISTVMVFDIITNTNFAETIDRVIVKVTPIFQYKYAYLKASESSINILGTSLNYSLAEDRVIPYPSSLSGASVNFNMTQSYFLKDISYGEALYNENNLNRFDVGYNPYNDYGSYFTAIDYTYNGRSREYGEFPTEEAITYGLDCVQLILTAIPVTSGIGDALGQIRGLIEPFANAISFGEGLSDHWFGHEITVSSGELTTQCLYQNRDDQLSHYRDSEGNPLLTKVAGLAVNTSDDQSVWFGVNDDVTGYFTVSHSGLNGQPVEYTRLVQEIALKVVDSNGDNIVATNTSSYTHFLREKNTKNVVDGEVNGYTIKNGYDRFTFRPAESDYYSITNYGPYTLNFRVNDGNSVQSYSSIARQQKLRLPLDKTKTYTIEVGGISSEADFHSFLLAVELDPEQIVGNGSKSLTLGANAAKWYRFAAGQNDVSVFSSTKNNIRISVYDANMTLIEDTTTSTSLEILTETGKEYFVCVQNMLTSSQTATFKHIYKSDTVVSGTVLSEPRYFKKEIDVLGTYQFNITSSKSLEITIYDNEHRILYETGSLQFFYAFEKTGKYIIGVRNLSNASAAVSYKMEFYAENVFAGINNLLYNEALEYNIYRFTPTATAKYSFTSANATSIQVMNNLTDAGNLNNGKLNARTIYFVKIVSEQSNPILNIGLTNYNTLQYNTTKTGTYTSDEFVIFKLAVSISGKYKIEYLNAQILLYDQNLEQVNVSSGNEFYAQANGEYSLKLVGALGNTYNVKYYFNPPDLKINNAQVIVADTYFKFTNSEKQRFILKTFGVDSITTKIRYSTDLVNFTESTNMTGHATVSVNWSANTYYIFIDITGSGYVGVSIEYADSEQYLTGEFKLIESEMYNINFLRLETKNYSITIPEIDFGKTYEIRLLKNVFANFQLAVDGKLIRGDDLEDGTVSRFTFSLTHGNHVISLRYDTNSSACNMDSVSLIFIKQIENLNFYLTEAESGILVRDGIRPGYEYNIQLVINGNIVSEHFIVENITTNTGIANSADVDEDMLSVLSTMPFDTEVMFRVNYAFVNYYISVDSLYPYRINSQVIKTDQEIAYSINAYNFYTNQEISDLEIDCITLEVKIDEVLIASFESEQDEYSIDLSTLNYYDNANLYGRVKINTDYIIELPTKVLPYIVTDTYKNCSTTRKFIYLDLTDESVITDSLTSKSFLSSVKVLNLKGNNNTFTFPGFLFNDDVTLNLYNIKLQGYRGKAPVQAEKSITINVLGDCSLLGSEGYFGTMTFEGSSGITVKNNLKINFMPIMSNSNTNQTKLTVTGGRLAFHFATNAPTGVTGTAGSTGTSSSKNGGNGGNGGNGSDGNNGGNGLTAIDCGVLKVAGAGTFVVTGGAGGDGGNGGNGGRGGNGGNGYSESAWFQAGGNGGNGGNGGYGGKGGNGGKGGAAIRCEAYETVATVATSLSGGAGGARGNGGSGGAGGAAGTKGSSGFLGGSATDGNPGISRTNVYAANGVKGADGAKIEYK